MSAGESVQLQSLEDGVLLPVKVRAGGRKNHVGGVHAGALRVEVTTAPEKGKANKAIIKMLAKSFGLAQRDIILKSGDTSSEKKFILSGLSAEKIQNIIQSLE